MDKSCYSKVYESSMTFNIVANYHYIKDIVSPFPT